MLQKNGGLNIHQNYISRSLNLKLVNVDLIKWKKIFEYVGKIKIGRKILILITDVNFNWTLFLKVSECANAFGWL